MHEPAECIARAPGFRTRRSRAQCFTRKASRTMHLARSAPAATDGCPAQNRGPPLEWSALRWSALRWSALRWSALRWSALGWFPLGWAAVASLPRCGRCHGFVAISDFAAVWPPLGWPPWRLDRGVAALVVGLLVAVWPPSLSASWPRWADVVVPGGSQPSLWADRRRARHCDFHAAKRQRAASTCR